jgi:hypothetical protein
MRLKSFRDQDLVKAPLELGHARDSIRGWEASLQEEVEDEAPHEQRAESLGLSFRSKLSTPMPTKKEPRKPAEPPWQVILEEIRSQNRATIESVEASRAALEQRIERLERDTSARDGVLEMAVRELKVTVQQNGIDIRGLQGDVRGLAAKVDTLVQLEERVTALEKRAAS